MLDEQPLHIWRVTGSNFVGLGGDDPFPDNGLVSFGIVSFDVLEDGPVWLAVTTRFGGGGNPSGDWIPELITRAELEADGWSEIATDMKSVNSAFNFIGLDFIVFERQSFAGESFTIRTEKFVAPLLLTTQFDPEVVPEPSSIVLLGIGCVALCGYGWRRKGKTA